MSLSILKLAQSRLKRFPMSMGSMFIIGIIAGMVLIAVLVALLVHRPQPVTPTPAFITPSLQSAVNFNIYYPDPSKLPAGFELVQNSFSASHEAVLYTVAFGNNQHLIFTLQKEPSTKDIDTFYANRMPLTITAQTSVGTANIGVLNHETVASLPTTTNAWVLMTAPLNTNQQSIIQVLKAMVRAPKT